MQQHSNEKLIQELKDVQKLLQAIINSSEEAISVVDMNGKGLMVNPAYTRLTGLSSHDVVGAPADVDISEGESMHMKVLRTRKSGSRSADESSA